MDRGPYSDMFSADMLNIRAKGTIEDHIARDVASERRDAGGYVSAVMAASVV